MKKLSPEQICFGLNRQLDEASFSCYLQLAGKAEFANLLSSRLSSEEMNEFIDGFTALLRKHITSTEYHSLFLQRNTTGDEPQTTKE